MLHFMSKRCPCVGNVPRLCFVRNEYFSVVCVIFNGVVSMPDFLIVARDTVLAWYASAWCEMGRCASVVLRLLSATYSSRFC